jgi:hypothetical protein
MFIVFSSMKRILIAASKSESMESAAMVYLYRLSFLPIKYGEMFRLCFGKPV